MRKLILIAILIIAGGCLLYATKEDEYLICQYDAPVFVAMDYHVCQSNDSTYSLVEKVKKLEKRLDSLEKHTINEQELKIILGEIVLKLVDRVEKHGTGEYYDDIAIIILADVISAIGDVATKDNIYKAKVRNNKRESK